MLRCLSPVAFYGIASLTQFGQATKAMILACPPIRQIGVVMFSRLVPLRVKIWRVKNFVQPLFKITADCFLRALLKLCDAILPVYILGEQQNKDAEHEIMRGTAQPCPF